MALHSTCFHGFCIVFVACLLRRIHGEEFIFGGEAERVCEAYKRICPAKKVCALQTIQFPSPMKFPVCVHEHHIVVKSKICRQAPVPGKCGAQFMRWYFNVHMGACSWFTYSGCGGNQNNFRTAEECEAKCMGADKDIFGASKDNAKEITAGHDDRRVPYISNSEMDNIIDEEIISMREPTFMTAPARAPEVLELDDKRRAMLEMGGSDAESESSQNVKNVGEKSQKLEKKKKLKKHKKTKQQKVKKIKSKKNGKGGKNRKHHPAVEGGSSSTGHNSIAGTAANEARNYAEMRGTQTSYQWASGNLPEKSTIWLMDGKFSGRQRSGRRNQTKSPRLRKTQATRTEAPDDLYYDKVRLFDILKHVENQKVKHG
ncbi:unnamed protein product [Lymnaea stagnalis]|uniref:BPTI/Kunitz inhibitor domain-containing protein n=1 Tax=Lymnaea stagnalis TaxID=6523 RepID=A0AAV2IGB1_LYMST